MSRKFTLKVGILLALLSVLPGCELTVPSQITVTTGSGGTGSTGGTKVTPTCTATPNPTTTASGVPIAVLVVANGTGPFTTAGIGSFTNSTTVDRTYTNTTSNQITVNDSVVVTDANNVSATCDFSVNVTATTTVTPALSCLMTANPQTITANQEVTYAVTATGGNGSLTFSNFTPGTGTTAPTVVVPFTQINATQGQATDQYTAAGSYTAMVKVSDSAGNTAACQQSITVGQAAAAPSITVSVSPSGTVSSGTIVTIKSSTANFTGTPTITYVSKNASGVTEPGVSIVPNASGSQATVEATDGNNHSFNMIVSAVSGSQNASVTIPVSFSSSIPLVCNLTFTAGTYYQGDTVPFTVTAAEPVEITSVTAANGTVTDATLPNPFSIKFTGAGSSTVTVQAKGTVSNKVCNSSSPMQQTLYINPKSTGSLISCNLTTSVNPTVNGTSFTAFATPSANDGTVSITGISTDQTVSGSWSLVSGNNLAASVTINTPGTFLLSATILDAATGQSAVCSLKEVVW